MKTIKIDVWIDSGSKFQEEVITKMMDAFLKICKANHESHHKKNCFDYSIEEEKNDTRK